MVKICKGLYINPLTVVFFIVCYLSGKAHYFVISYLSMFLHELAHLFAACCIGLKPSHFSLHPFGINLRLKSNMVFGVAEDIILYCSGPLLNLLISLVFITVLKNKYLYDYGFAVNIMLFFINFLPIYPLDGGNILKRILSQRLSEHATSVIMKSISAVLSVAIFSIGVYVVYSTGYNYSAIFISILIFCNTFTVQEKYSETAIKNLVYTKRMVQNKSGKPIRMYVSDRDTPHAKFLKYIRPGAFTCVAVVGEDGEIEKLITERELVQEISRF